MKLKMFLSLVIVALLSFVASGCAKKAAPAEVPQVAAEQEAQAEAAISVEDIDPKELQRALNDHGAKLRVDGIIGQRTRAALETFQANNGIPVTGELDGATAVKLGLK